MIHKTFFTSSKKTINVFDDVFSFQEQSRIEIAMSMSGYNLNAISSVNTSHIPSSFLHSRLDERQIQDLEFFSNKNVLEILKPYRNLTFSVGWFNLSLPGTYYNIHADSEHKSLKKLITLMYCGTTTWEEKYGGETFFYSDNLEKEIVVDYKPGRIVVFDSTIPHKPAFSYGHTVGRYMFVTIFFVE